MRESIDGLRAGFRGRLLEPADVGYDEARKVWNGMIDKRPAVIAQCTGTADVVAAVNYARRAKLSLAVRGGGHNVSGNAVCSGGLVVDLTPMKTVVVDSERRVARAEGGVTWGEYDRETQRYGLASPGGAISSTGIAGLTLGGGFGWLSRSYGLACDNLVSAELVTASGEVVTTSADESPDLFWAIRGGGGNFGVVTQFEYRLHEVGELYSGLVLYPRSQARAFLRMYARLTAAAPDQLSSMAAFLSTPDGDPVVGAFMVFNGSADAAEQALQPLRSFESPVLDDIGRKPYTAVQQAFDEGMPAGNRNYWKSTYLAALGDDCIDTIVNHANEAPSPMSLVAVEHMIGGAVSRVDPSATAFGSRAAEYNLLILGVGNDPSIDDANKEWVRGLWKAVQPFSTGGVYVNYMDRDESDRISEAYDKGHYERLAATKKRFDPANLFRLNQNIAPTS